MAAPYLAEGPRKYASWKGTPIVTHHRILGTILGQIILAGLQIEALLETPVDPIAVKEETSIRRAGSAARAQMMPTTFIIKARKPDRSCLAVRAGWVTCNAAGFMHRSLENRSTQGAYEE
jgi:hypothetical protein